MRIITRYILREVAVPSLLALFVISFIAVAKDLEERAEVLRLELITAWDLVRLAGYFLPTLVSIIIPYTFMMGILLAFSRLASQNEITAMRAAGIPLRNLLMPILVTGGLLSVASFFIQDVGQPWGVQRFNQLIYEDLAKRATLEMLAPGEMHVFGDAEWRVFIESRDEATGRLHDIEILAPQDDGSFWVYHAATAEVVRGPKASGLLLRDGHLIMPDQEGMLVRNTFPEWMVELPALEALRAPSQRRQLSLAGLLKEEDRLSDIYEDNQAPRVQQELARARNEAALRVAWPLSCLAMCLVAAPLAVRAQRAARSFSFAIGATVGLAHYLLFLVTEPRGLLPLGATFALALSGNLLLCVIGVVLTWRVDRV